MPLRPFSCLISLVSALAALSLGVAACSSADLKSTGGSGQTDGGGGSGSDGATGAKDGAVAEPDAGTLAAEGGVIGLTGNVSIIVEPSDNGAALLAAVKGAKKSVHVTMYLLTDNGMESALFDQKTAGHDVQVLLNTNFPSGQGNGNLPAYNYLTKNGVPVKWAPTAFTFTHAKTIIIDGTDAWIMTMNATFSSPTSNREFLVVDHDSADVADAEKIFAADWVNQQLTLVTKLVVSPQTGSTVDARTRMLAIINGATQTLDVAGEELSDTGIVNAMIAKHKAGVPVRAVLSGTGTPSPYQQTAVANLKAAGIAVKSLSKPDMHAKTIIADDVRAYVGSQNFTSTSLNQNRELGVLVSNATEVGKIATTFDKDFAAGTAL
jgi:phosphatidylserine/phosphatidylglycerophosphate/cardiolipin synthase-like enzyme